MGLASCADDSRHDDSIVLGVVAQDFSRSPGEFSKPGMALVRPTTKGPSYYLSGAIVRSDAGTHVVADELIESLSARNRAAATVHIECPVRCDGVRVLRSSEAQAANTRAGLSTPFGATAVIEFWLPGYSADRRTALVRFAVAPSPHGATGTYLLRRNHDCTSSQPCWSVVWRKLAFYA
jgi:hypothetical protein